MKYNSQPKCERKKCAYAKTKYSPGSVGLIISLLSSIPAADMQGVPSSRAAVDAQHFLHTNRMCNPDQLIGSFEFVSSEPDGLDGMIPDLPCPKP